MRNNLILKFYCSECGARLEIITSYEMPAKIETVSSDEESPQYPSGARVEEMPVVSIKPCRRCIEKYVRPAKHLVDAIKEMTENERRVER